MDLKKLNYLVIDVDGTMTDGGIYYDENGSEIKKFNTRDAAGFFAAKAAGIKIIVLTGRECAATTRRMNELKVDFIFQNIKNKKEFLSVFMEEKNIVRKEIGYIGDDLNDLAPMKLTGYIACPSDSCREIKDIADYISSNKGGYGAVRDIIEHILCERGIWNKVVSEIYMSGI